jgi:hypothetical protein
MRLHFALALLSVITTAGCASVVQLNDPAKSISAVDVATLESPRKIPYELQERNGLKAIYNLSFIPRGNFTGYRLTLIFKNEGSQPRVIEPRIAVQDSTGMVLSPNSYEAVMTQAAALAGTAVSPMLLAGPSTATYYQSGTVRNTMTGNTYQYSGYSTSAPSGGFAAGLASGMAQGAAMRAVADRNEGVLMLRWTNAFYLKSRYELPSGGVASGALLYPAASLAQLPLKLTIEAGGDRFEFLTASKLE